MERVRVYRAPILPGYGTAWHRSTISRVRNPAAVGARWCWWLETAMLASGPEISLRARVHGSRENREPPVRQKRPATEETRGP